MAVTKDGIFESVNTLSKLVGAKDDLIGKMHSMVCDMDSDLENLKIKASKMADDVTLLSHSEVSRHATLYAAFTNLASDFEAEKAVAAKRAEEQEQILQNIAATMLLLVQQVKALQSDASVAPAPEVKKEDEDVVGFGGMTVKEKKICVGLTYVKNSLSTPLPNGASTFVQPIETIKLVRFRTGLGLKESRDLVQAWAKSEEGQQYMALAVGLGVSVHGSIVFFSP